MKISILADTLQKKISFVNHAISSRNQLPILSQLLLEAKEGKLFISATDLEIGIEVNIPVSIDEEGATTIPAKLFTELISSLPAEKITLQTKEGALEVVSKKTSSTFQTMNREEFPVLYVEKGEEILRVKGDVLEKDLSKVSFAASIETTRPALSGVLIKKTIEGCMFVATDGYRLSLKIDSSQKAQATAEVSVLVPARVIREVLGLSKEQDIVLYISEKNNQVIFSADDTVLIGRLIEAEFPNYQKIIPTDVSTTSFFEREDLQKAIKTCAIFAREASNIVKLSLQKEKIVVSAKTPSLGENTVELDAKLQGEENEIAFNARYLLELLSNVDENELSFEMTGPLNSGVFKIANDSSFLHLIMPIRV